MILKLDVKHISNNDLMQVVSSALQGKGSVTFRTYTDGKNVGYNIVFTGLYLDCEPYAEFKAYRRVEYALMYQDRVYRRLREMVKQAYYPVSKESAILEKILKLN